MPVPVPPEKVVGSGRSSVSEKDVDALAVLPSAILLFSVAGI